jgi:hypothetical protein
MIFAVWNLEFGIWNFRSYLLNKPDNKEMRNNTMKMKNNIFATEAAPAAIPPNPNMAAIMATTKKISAQRNIT